MNTWRAMASMWSRRRSLGLATTFIPCSALSPSVRLDTGLAAAHTKRRMTVLYGHLPDFIGLVMHFRSAPGQSSQARLNAIRTLAGLASVGLLSAALAGCAPDLGPAAKARPIDDYAAAKT